MFPGPDCDAVCPKVVVSNVETTLQVDMHASHKHSGTRDSTVQRLRREVSALRGQLDSLKQMVPNDCVPDSLSSGTTAGSECSVSGAGSDATAAGWGPPVNPWRRGCWTQVRRTRH